MKLNSNALRGPVGCVVGRLFVWALSAFALSGCGGSDSPSPPLTHSLSGTVTGLTADGLVLVAAGGKMTLSAGMTSFTSTTVFYTGEAYSVTLESQPTTLLCSVANGSGTFGTANVSNVAVTCVPNYSLGGTISGLTGAGLVLANGGETLSVNANSDTFAFATRFNTDSAYSVAVQSSPWGITCSVANGTGNFGTANIDNVVVTCSDQGFSLGGAISGLNTAGLVLANGSDQLSVPAGSSTFTMPAPVAFTSSYTVTVATQPQGSSCSVQSGTGTMGAAAVTNVAVVCSNVPYTLGGSISGLSVAGLVLANGTDTVAVTANASHFALPTALAFSTPYAVTVATQPVGVTCSVTQGSGTMPANNVTSVVVVCSTNAYTVGGSISGLTKTGLVLANGTDTVNVAMNATGFTLPTAVAFGSTYQVTVATQPTHSVCTVSNGSGTMQTANITNVAVTCAVTAYTLGGTLSGLTATGLVLTDGTDSLSVAANAAIFSMPTGVAIGSAYAVTVQAQPAGLICTVTGGSGTMPSADVSSPQVACVARMWTWETGSNMIGSEGTLGTQGVAAAGNTPSERDNAMRWTDRNGRLWLFGGGDQYSGRGGVSDLWRFDPGTQLWTWMKGPSTSNSVGSFGTKGVAAAGNVPSSRNSGVTWVDAAGHLWLFGGVSGAPGFSGYLNDLWMYDISTNNWTWVGGANVVNDPGSFGTQGVTVAGNLPPSRVYGLGWTDNTGLFWLYGGAGTAGMLGDMWTYDSTANRWTWVSGSSTAANVTPVFGTQGVAAAGNTPGARQGTATWADGSGHLWLYGGTSINPSSAQANYGDTWSYDIAANRWTWVNGGNSANSAGTVGSLGIAAAGNNPGARSEMGFTTDNAGRFWMFGGSGTGDGAAGPNGGWLSDLWMLDPATQQWTWVKGPSTPSNAGGIYGTKGTPAINNVPGGRVFPMCWVDSSGSLWMFGGYGGDASGSHFDLNDLWKF